MLPHHACQICTFKDPTIYKNKKNGYSGWDVGSVKPSKAVLLELFPAEQTCFGASESRVFRSDRLFQLRIRFSIYLPALHRIPRHFLIEFLCF